MSLSDAERDRKIDEHLAKRGGRRIESPMVVTQRMGVALSLAASARNLSTAEQRELMSALPRNRAEARRYLKGQGPYGLARRRG